MSHPPSRGTLVRHRVCVYPPGTNGPERRALTAHRDWPVLGAIIALVALTVFGRGILTDTAPHWLGRRLFRRSLPHRTAHASFEARSRTVTATFVNLYDSVETHGDAESVLRVTREFAKLDASLHSGELSPRSL